MDNYRGNVVAFNEAIKIAGNFFIYDTETTGLNPDESSVLEFAAIKIDSDFNIVDKINVYINNGNPVPEVITELTGITTAEIEAIGVSPLTAAQQIKSFLGENPILCGYNSVSFDTKFMERLFNNELSAPFTQLMQLDVLTMAREKTPKPHKLCDMAEKAGVEDMGFHRADADCVATYYVLKYLLPMYETAEPRTDMSTFVITGIRPWKKSHTLNRIYIGNNLNWSIYYDVYKKEWVVDKNVDPAEIKERVLKFTGLDSENDFIKVYENPA